MVRMDVHLPLSAGVVPVGVHAKKDLPKGAAALIAANPRWGREISAEEAKTLGGGASRIPVSSKLNTYSERGGIGESDDDDEGEESTDPTKIAVDSDLNKKLLPKVNTDDTTGGGSGDGGAGAGGGDDSGSGDSGSGGATGGDGGGASGNPATSPTLEAPNEELTAFLDAQEPEARQAYWDAFTVEDLSAFLHSRFSIEPNNSRAKGTIENMLEGRLLTAK